MNSKPLRYYSAKPSYELDVREYQVAIAAGKKFIVPDTRTADSTSKEHILSALSIPLPTMTDASTFSSDGNAIVVTCWERIGCQVQPRMP